MLRELKELKLMAKDKSGDRTESGAHRAIFHLKGKIVGILIQGDYPV